MQIAFRTIHLRKKIPLAISRGVSTSGDNLFVTVTHDGITGHGEMAPGARQGAADVASGRAALTEFFAHVFAGNVNPPAVRAIYAHAREQQLPACALAALDVALWDWTARKAGLPLYQLLGLAAPRAPTSITLGICSPQVARERVPQLLAGEKFRALKVKLGCADGVDADREMFAAVLECIGKRAIKVRVDANGGWSVADARAMMKWLAARGVEYVEQPLRDGCEDDLPAIYKNRPLPIFVDESCRFAEDIPAFANAVDGVNLKLMKCGGITGALHIIAVARAFQLQTMVGCMSESSLAISAAAALGGALDYIDLDSHFNLDPDPCTGAQLIDGVLMPNAVAGHGASITADNVK